MLLGADLWWADSPPTMPAHDDPLTVLWGVDPLSDDDQERYASERPNASIAEETITGGDDTQPPPPPPPTGQDDDEVDPLTVWGFRLPVSDMAALWSIYGGSGTVTGGGGSGSPPPPPAPVDQIQIIVDDPYAPQVIGLTNSIIDQIQAYQLQATLGWLSNILENMDGLNHTVLPNGQWFTVGEFRSLMALSTISIVATNPYNNGGVGGMVVNTSGGGFNFVVTLAGISGYMAHPWGLFTYLFHEAAHATSSGQATTAYFRGVYQSRTLGTDPLGNNYAPPNNAPPSVYPNYPEWWANEQHAWWTARSIASMLGLDITYYPIAPSWSWE